MLIRTLLFLSLGSLAISSSFANAAPSTYRVISGTNAGFGIAWGLKGRKIDFEKVLREGTGEEVINKNEKLLVNYLVDLRSGRILTELASWEKNDVIDYDIHPTYAGLPYFELKEFEFYGNNESSVLEIKADTHVNYRMAQSNLPTYMLIISRRLSADTPSEQPEGAPQVVASCADCYEQIQNLIKGKLTPKQRKALETIYTHHDFTFSTERGKSLGYNTVVLFHLDASGAWNDEKSGTLSFDGKLALRIVDKQIRLSLLSLKTKLNR